MTFFQLCDELLTMVKKRIRKENNDNKICPRRERFHAKSLPRSGRVQIEAVRTNAEKALRTGTLAT